MNGEVGGRKHREGWIQGERVGERGETRKKEDREGERHRRKEGGIELGERRKQEK